MGTEEMYEESKENFTSSLDSPDKTALKAMLEDQSIELNNSRIALLQMLAVQADSGASSDAIAADSVLDLPQGKHRKQTDDKPQALKQRRQSSSNSSSNNSSWFNQITSRDRIIAELRARNQELKDDAAILVMEREKLQRTARGERRLREQHSGLMAAVKALKAQGEETGEALAASRQQVVDLQAKLKHEASKTTMHRETQRVLDNELSAKQDVLSDAHATLSVLHQRYTALTQVMSQATKSAFAAKLCATAKQAEVESAQEVMTTIRADMQSLATRCNTLLSDLRLAHEARQAAEMRADGAIRDLRELQADRGVGPLAARAAEADVWQRKAAEAAEKLERMRVSYQRARKQHDAMEARLVDAGMTSPMGPLDGRSVVVQMPLTPPTPIDATMPSGSMSFSTPEPSNQGPVNERDRAKWLNVEVTSIRSRITALKTAFKGDPTVAALAIT